MTAIFLHTGRRQVLGYRSDSPKAETSLPAAPSLDCAEADDIVAETQALLQAALPGRLPLRHTQPLEGPLRVRKNRALLFRHNNPVTPTPRSDQFTEPEKSLLRRQSPITSRGYRLPENRPATPLSAALDAVLVSLPPSYSPRFARKHHFASHSCMHASQHHSCLHA